jgi:hypothetical protein
MGPMVGLLHTLVIMPHSMTAHFPLYSSLLVIFQNSDKQEGVYDILWAVVFGFATLNIVGLALRRFETTGNRLNLGEILAIMVVGVSVVLLGWEMLYVLKILPIKLQPHD